MVCPSARRKITRARMTSRYGMHCERALCSNLQRSDSVNSIWIGVCALTTPTQHESKRWANFLVTDLRNAVLSCLANHGSQCRCSQTDSQQPAQGFGGRCNTPREANVMTPEERLERVVEMLEEDAVRLRGAVPWSTVLRVCETNGFDALQIAEVRRHLLKSEVTARESHPQTPSEAAPCFQSVALRRAITRVSPNAGKTLASAGSSCARIRRLAGHEESLA